MKDRLFILKERRRRDSAVFHDLVSPLVWWLIHFHKEKPRICREITECNIYLLNTAGFSRQPGRRSSVPSQSRCKEISSMADKRMSSSKKHALKSMMLVVAKDLLEAEDVEKKEERKKYMEENCPPLSYPGSKDELQALCKELHEKIDVLDEERYILEHKAIMVVNEVKDLNIKIIDLKGKFKKPPLKKVRMSADAMLQALLGSKHKVSMDLRANLKQVKKEVKEEDKELRDVGDWRKNIEDKAGMGGRKKMFESEA